MAARAGIAPSVVDRIKATLVGLRMPRALEIVDAIVRQLERGEVSALEAIDAILAEELTLRESRRIKTSLVMARLSTIKTLAGFDFTFQPSLDRNRILALAELKFIEHCEVVHLIGPPGTGKSHLAQALGHAAVRQGVDVAFSTCANLTASLNAARATGAFERKLASLARIGLLVIDDFGLKPLRPPADEDLHELIAERYETGAIIVTSNLDLPEWDQAFPANRLLASATLDRLRHNAYCLTLDGLSYRAPKQSPVTAPAKLANPSKTRHS